METGFRFGFLLLVGLALLGILRTMGVSWHSTSQSPSPLPSDGKATE